MPLLPLMLLRVPCRRLNRVIILIQHCRIAVYIALALSAQWLLIYLHVKTSTTEKTGTALEPDSIIGDHSSGNYTTGSGIKWLNGHLNNTQDRLPVNLLAIVGPHKVLHDMKVYFTTGLNKSTPGCFVQGSDLALSNATHCSCAPDWFGPHCSFPSAVKEANVPPSFIGKMVPRTRPRKVIVAFPFHMEFDLLELRLHQLSDVTDVFLLLESNYTSFGDPKPQYFKERVTEGHYTQFLSKIVHVTLPVFPKEAHKQGWVELRLLRNYISQVGLKKLSNIAQDDLFVLNDADEIPNREVLLFLKLHDGYPEPVTLGYHWTVYGFFWKYNQNALQEIPSVVSLRMLSQVYENKAFAIRKLGRYFEHIFHNVNSLNNLNKMLQSKTYSTNKSGSFSTRKLSLVNRYIQQGGLVYPWTVGSLQHPAGFHCSWCSIPEGIRNKMLSAPNSDFPRWGSIAEKTTLKFIRHLIKTGMWFDDKYHLFPAYHNDTPYAPDYFVQNRNKYEYLLNNTY